MGKLNIKFLKSNTVKIFLMAFALYIISGILQPTYFKLEHLMVILVLACFLGIITIGQTIVIISGGIDLSVAYTVTLIACVYAETTKNTGSGFTGLIVAMVVALIVGIFKGAGVAYLKITPMVMTLATNAILMSVTYLFTNGVLKGSSTDLLKSLAKGDILGIRYCVLIWFILGIGCIFILRKTTFGREIYAIGSNIRVAELSGINTGWVLIGTYIIATLMMAIAGVLLVGYLGYPNYTMGDGYQLISISAVVIGGTSILGGEGGYLGTIGGVIIIYLIQSILTILNMAEAGKEIVNGLIILVILYTYGRGKMLNR
jgi:ribose transport system permease protein